MNESHSSSHSSLPLAATLDDGTIPGRHARPLPTAHPLLVASIVAAGIIAWILDLPADLFVIATGATVLLIAAHRYRSSHDLFHPLVFPTVYVAYVLIAPWVYIRVTGRPLAAIDTASMDRPTIWIMLLTVAGWLLGSLTLLRLRAHAESRRAPGPTLGASIPLVHIGRAMFVLTALGKITQIRLSSGVSYGEAQTTYGALSAVTTATEGFFLAATVVVVAANLASGRPPFSPYDWCVFLTLTVASIAYLGSRSELIGPGIVVLWAYTRRHRMRASFVLILTLLIVQLFIYVGNTRSQYNQPSEGNGLERSLVDLSSPYMITDVLTQILPSDYAYSNGSTYVAALSMTLPGPVSRALVADTPQTAAYVYRDMIGYTNPNQGFGFSLPSEAYLNFGAVGAFVAALLVGALLARAYSTSLAGDPRRARKYLYILLVAAVPYGLRSDALGQIKLTVYPMLILTVAALVARHGSGRRSSPGAEAGTDGVADDRT